MTEKVNVKKNDIYTEREWGKINHRNQGYKLEVLALGRLRQEDNQFNVKVGYKVRA